MRTILVLAVTFVATLVVAPPAGAAVPGKRIATYCSTSGDLCFGIFSNRGLIILEITTFERYFGRYRVCVDGPRGAEVCRSFPIRKRGRFYASTVRWHRNFPREGAGVYRVTWKLESRLGPTLKFRR